MSAAEAVQAAVVAAALCAAVAGVLPRLVARLPEPEPDPDLERLEGPKPPYPDLASSPGFAPAVVWGAAAAGAVAGASLGWDWYLAAVLPAVPFGAALAVVDLRARLLPLRLVYPAVALALAGTVVVWVATGEPDALVLGVLGYLAVGLVYGALWWLRPAGLGFGDVRAAALTGLLLAPLGWVVLVVALWLSSALFALLQLAGALARRDLGRLRVHQPLGPFLLGAVPIGLAIQRPLTSLLGA